MSANWLIKCGKEFKGNGGSDGRKGGAMWISKKVFTVMEFLE